MKKFFYNLKLREKLLSGFIIIAIVLIVTGIQQYRTLKMLEKGNEQITNNVDLKDHIKEAKLVLSSDMRVIERINSAADTSELRLVRLSFESTIERFSAVLQGALNTPGSEQFDKKQKTIFSNLSKAIELHDSILVIQIDTMFYAAEYLLKADGGFETLEVEPISDDFMNIEGFFAGETEIISDLDDDTLMLSDEIISDTLVLGNEEGVEEDFLNYFMTEDEDLIEEEIEFEAYKNLLNEFTSISDLTIKSINENLSEAERIASNIIKSGQETMNQKVRFYMILSSTILFLGLLVSFIISYWVADYIVNPIRGIKNKIDTLRKGVLPTVEKSRYSDELGQVTNSLRDMIEGYRKAVIFSLDLGKGELDTGFTPLSDDDVLGNSLIEMRKNFIESEKEERKRKIEDEKRNWAAEGLSNFGEILRQHGSDTDKLSDALIIALVKYLKANQGGFFLTNDNKELELKAAYAYNRKKHYQKTIKFGIGLVGTVAVEKATIYIKDIPDNYTEIRSGLGSAAPTTLLVVPMKIDDRVLGVIEVASFREFNDYEIKFVERIAENIASAFSTARINARTADLLKQSRTQAEQMAAKEAERQQYIREMTEAQEDALKREKELTEALANLQKTKEKLDEQDKKLTKEYTELKEAYNDQISRLSRREKQSRNILESALDGVIIINEQGIIEFFNDSAQKIWGYTESEVLDKNVAILMTDEHSQQHDHFMERYKETGEKHIIGIGREVKILRKDDSQTSVFLSVIETKVDGKSKFTAFIKDLTDKVGYEQKLSSMLEDSMAKEFENLSYIEKLEKVLIDNNLKDQIPKRHTDVLIEFDDTIITGIESIDIQHKKLVDITNEIYLSFKKNRATEEIMQKITALLKYAKEHFKYEEDIMNDLEYESLSVHKKMHKKFALQILEYRDRFKKGKLESSYELLNFLKEWIEEHIKEKDRQYVQLFKDNDIE